MFVGSPEGCNVGALVDGTLVGCDVGCVEGCIDNIYEDGRDKKNSKSGIQFRYICG